MEKSSSKSSQTLLLVALIAALLFGAYYYLVLPKKDEVAAKESSVASLQSQVNSLKQQIEVAKAEHSSKTVDVYALRKKVPDSRAVDKLLLDLEQIEFVADARINSISFNNYDSLVNSSGLTDPNANAEQNNQSGNNNNQSGDNAQSSDNAQSDGSTNNSSEQQNNNEAVQTPVSTISPDQLPAALKMLTLGLAVEAPTYEDLLSFIKEIEKLDRVVRVDTISYSLNGEESVYNPEVSDIVSANIQVTTFYYEGDQ